ncbi:reverse transcriptase domain-containing protein, partial [Tanacetum coccineum]
MKCLNTLSKFVKSLTYGVEAKALPTNDARVVVKFSKSLFARFGTPRAIISDCGTHFCNDQFAKVMSKYGVTHRLATAYHPQTSGQASLSKKKKLKKAHKQKSSSFKQGRKKVYDGSTSLNEVDVNEGTEVDVNEGTEVDVNEGTEVGVNEGAANVNESTAKVHEGTDEILEDTAQVNEGTTSVNEVTAEETE